MNKTEKERGKEDYKGNVRTTMGVTMTYPETPKQVKKFEKRSKDYT